jgi:hypothetical protein
VNRPLAATTASTRAQLGGFVNGRHGDRSCLFTLVAPTPQIRVDLVKAPALRRRDRDEFDDSSDDRGLKLLPEAFNGIDGVADIVSTGGFSSRPKKYIFHTVGTDAHCRRSYSRVQRTKITACSALISVTQITTKTAVEAS